MKNLDFFRWGLRPEIFELGDFRIRWYGLLFAAAFVAGYLIMRWIYQVERKPLRDLDELLIYMMLGTIVGARLGHCLFYEPDYYLYRPLEILKVWRGGLASHGGALGILIALYLYSRQKQDQTYLWLLSRISITTALGGFFIRLGNFFNSEIIGRASDVPWAVVFTRVDSIPRHPSQLYESLAYLLISIVLVSMYRKNRENTDSKLLLGSFFVLVFGFRILIECTKVIQADFEKDLILHMGQLLSIPFVILGAMLIYQALFSKPRTTDSKPATQE